MTASSWNLFAYEMPGFIDAFHRITHNYFTIERHTLSSAHTFWYFKNSAFNTYPGFTEANNLQVLTGVDGLNDEILEVAHVLHPQLFQEFTVRNTLGTDSHANDGQMLQFLLHNRRELDELTGILGVLLAGAIGEQVQRVEVSSVRPILELRIE